MNCNYEIETITHIERQVNYNVSFLSGFILKYVLLHHFVVSRNNCCLSVLGFGILYFLTAGIIYV